MAKPVPGTIAGRGRSVALAGTNGRGVSTARIAGSKQSRAGAGAGRRDGGPSSVQNGVKSNVGVTGNH